MRHALRSLLKSPGYTMLAVGALALGIGANTVLFSVINTLFLRPLAFPDSGQLVRVWGSFPDRGLEQANLSWPRFSALRDQQESFTALAAESFPAFVALTGAGEPEQVQAQRVTERFFPTLGVQPVLGRTFTATEDVPGGPDVVLLSHGFWQRRFGGNPGIIGQALVLGGRPHTVIGVLPATFGFPFAQTQVWTPQVFDQEGIPPDLRERGTGYLIGIGRLKPGVSIAQAEEELRVISKRYGLATPDRVDANAGLNVISMQEDFVGGQRPMALTLLGAVGCVLLVACANVGNLLLARFTARRKEIAIRTALGASRGRIIAQFLAESVLTAALAGAVGVLLAVWGVDLLARIAVEFIPRAAELSLDGRVLGFAVVLSLLTGVVLGIVPAAQASHVDPIDSLKDSARGSTGGKHTGRFRAGLLVAEVALSLVLLVGAALLIDSFRRLQRVDPGFRADGVATFNLNLPPAAYPTSEHKTRLLANVLAKIRTLPGVTHAAAISNLPVVAGGFTRSPAAVEGRAMPRVDERLSTSRSTVTPDYFASLGIPLKQGRDFTWRDRENTTKVVIINEALAKRLFGNEDPIGRRLVTGVQSIPREIVGVVADTRSFNLTEPPIEEMYYPAAQDEGGFFSVVARVAAPTDLVEASGEGREPGDGGNARSAASLRSELVAAVHAFDPGLPVAEVQPFADLLADAIADRRLVMLLLGSFAALALLLASMGIYSVIAYSVAQRTNEFGIRMALGAAPGQVVKLVMKEGLRFAGLGLAIGLVLAFALTRLMQRLLFEVSPSDPLVYVGVALFLSAIAAAACIVPARRATKVDPITALRAE